MKTRVVASITLSLFLMCTVVLGINVKPAHADDLVDFIVTMADQVGDVKDIGNWIGHLNDPVMIGPLILAPEVLGPVAFAFSIGYRTGEAYNSIVDGTADLSIGGILKMFKRIIVGEQPGNASEVCTYDWTETYGNGTIMEGSFTFNGICENPSSVSSVGGVVVPIDKLGLLAPYIGFASTILTATVATAVYVKRVNRRKEE